MLRSTTPVHLLERQGGQVTAFKDKIGVSSFERHSVVSRRVPHRHLTRRLLYSHTQSCYQCSSSDYEFRVPDAYLLWRTKSFDADKHPPPQAGCSYPPHAPLGDSNLSKRMPSCKLGGLKAAYCCPSSGRTRLLRRVLLSTKVEP